MYGGGILDFKISDLYNKEASNIATSILLNRSLGEGCPNGKFSEERCMCVRARGLCDGEAAEAPWANPGLGAYFFFLLLLFLLLELN